MKSDWVTWWLHGYKVRPCLQTNQTQNLQTFHFFPTTVYKADMTATPYDTFYRRDDCTWERKTLVLAESSTLTHSGEPDFLRKRLALSKDFPKPSNVLTSISPSFPASAHNFLLPSLSASDLSFLQSDRYYLGSPVCTNLDFRLL